MSPQIDEAMLRNPKHPGHTSGREGAWAAILILILGTIFFSTVEVTWINRLSKIWLTLSVAVAVGVVVGRYFSGMNKRSRAKLEEQYRADQEVQKQKQIEKMRREASDVPEVKR